MIHSPKPDPVTNIQDPQRIFDFMTLTPESMHMLTWLFSLRGIPANDRQQEGFGVNTYTWINAAGEAVLVTYHWKPKQGVKSLTQPEANEIQATNSNHATQDLHQANERGDHPEWESCVLIMADNEHPELVFDPLDDTKFWPEDQFPLLPVGRMALDRTPVNLFAEVEQAAFGTGVLVDGLDFSDDKMLQGRTFSYSDTHRYRVGPNYLQLPINRPQREVNTNQRDGAMAFYVDGAASGTNPHVNDEPNSLGGVKQAPRVAPPAEPFVEGRLVRHDIERTSPYQQAGERYRAIQERVVTHFTQCDAKYGAWVAAVIGLGVEEMAGAAGSDEGTPDNPKLGRTRGCGWLVYPVHNLVAGPSAHPTQRMESIPVSRVSRVRDVIPHPASSSLSCHPEPAGEGSRRSTPVYVACLDSDRDDTVGLAVRGARLGGRASAGPRLGRDPSPAGSG